MGHHIRHGVIAAAAIGLQALLVAGAHAQCVPSTQPGLVCPSDTIGKEYSVRPDTDASLVTPPPSQTLL